MKRRELSYVIFAGIGSIAAIGSALTLLLVAMNRTKTINEYPSYSYSEYIDRSESLIFDENAGAQLFEAESLDIAGSARISDNIHASKQKIVSTLSTGSTLSFTFNAEQAGEAKLVFATSYISQTNHSILSDNLFKITFNNSDLVLESSITPSYNEYDFIENDIALLKINKGENHFTLVSYNNLYTLDYLLLVSPKEKTSTEESISYYQENFDALGRKKTFEAEIQNDLDGAVVLEEYNTNSGYSLYFTNPGDVVSFYINSNEETDSDLSLNVRKSDKSRSAPGVSLTVNDQDVPISPMSSISENYKDIDFGNVHLNKGLNTIQVTNLGGSFLLDNISLNSNINFSDSIDQLRFEAEDGTLQGGCSTVIASTTESKNAVGYNFAGSYVEFKLKSLEQATSHFALTLSYVGAALPLNEIISVQINGYEIPNMSKEVFSSTGDYTNYVDVYGGKFTLPQGENILRIVSMSGNYNLDCITFFDVELSSNTYTEMVEAEDLMTKNIKTQFNQTASNHYCLKNTEENSHASLYLYMEAEAKVNLRMNLASPSSFEYYVDEYISLTINRKETDLKTAVKLSSTSFVNIDLGNYTLQQGLNKITITNFDLVYYLDYLLFTL